MPETLRKILLAAVAVVVTLGAAELALRAAGTGKITPELNFGVNTRGALERGAFEAHADLFWTLPSRPTQLDQALAAVHPSRAVPPKGERKRLIVLGDSCSRISQRTLPYSGLLADRLLGRGWEVLNAAVPGYTTHQGLAWLRLQLLDLQPDLVVVYFGWNDHWRATGVKDEAYAASQSPRSLRLLQLLRRPPATPPLRVPPEDYRSNLRRIVDAVRGAGARVVLVAAPSGLSAEAQQRLAATRYVLPGEDAGELHREYLRIVAEFTGESDVAVFAADKLVAALPGDLPLLMRDGIHLTDDGHVVFAAALERLLTTGAGRDGELPPSLVEAAGRALDEFGAEHTPR